MGSERAFRELVERYVNLVYSAAIRHLEEPQLAQDVVQTVFTALARKARTLPRDVILGGWLYRHTCFVASQAARTERRRRARERQALEMNALNDQPEPDWERLAPFLDQAMQGLGTSDRDAVVLRYFEGRNLRHVGAALGISEEAARKRVTRALEKLRSFLPVGESLSPPQPWRRCWRRTWLSRRQPAWPALSARRRSRRRWPAPDLRSRS